MCEKCEWLVYPHIKSITNALPREITLTENMYSSMRNISNVKYPQERTNQGKHAHIEKECERDQPTQGSI